MTKRSSIAAMAAVGWVLAACGGSPGGRDARIPGTGTAQVRIEFADLDRVHAALSGLRGRPALVNFWATWCSPCVEELPDLAELAREEGGRAGFAGISLDGWVTGNGTETEEKVKRALADAGVAYLNLIYTGDQDPLIEGLGLPGPIPYSVLYDAQGNEAASWTGKAAIPEVREAIAAAERKSPPARPAGSAAAPVRH